MLFDARVLAAYLVSSNVFANPAQPAARRASRRGRPQDALRRAYSGRCGGRRAPRWTRTSRSTAARRTRPWRARWTSRATTTRNGGSSPRGCGPSRAAVLAALFGGDAESLGARQVRLAEDAARRNGAAAVWWSRMRTSASSRRRRRARRRGRRRRTAPSRTRSWRARRGGGTTPPSGRAAPKQPRAGCFRRRRGPGRAGASTRRATRTHQCCSRGTGGSAPRGRVRRRSTARRANGRVAAGAGPLPCAKSTGESKAPRNVDSYTGPLGAADARDPRRRFGRGRRRVARVGAEAGAVLRGGRRGAAAGARDAGRLDPRRRGRGALRAPRGRIRRRRGAVPELPPLARRAAAAAAPERARRDRAAAARARADGAAAAPRARHRHPRRGPATGARS